MVWSKHDFEREVRRQLVEIESIRKRLPESPEVHERIDRLAASHRHLIRKLDEVFPVNSKRPSLPAGPARRSAPKRARARPANPPPGQAPAHGRYRLPRPPRSYAGAHQTAAVPKKKVTAPGIHEKCAACGKVLLASVILGREVVFLNEAWYHRNCASKGSLN
jgi:hypothetical protein